MISAAALLARQARHQWRCFWRTPVALFFTLLLPLVMLVLFNALFDGSVETPEGNWPVRQFYTGGLAAFAAVSATYTNLGNTLPILRDEGVLKRWRGTPLPPWVYLGGVVLSALALAAAGALLMLGLGVVAYGLEVDAAKLPAAVLTFVVGVTAFAAMGLAIAAVVPTARSAPAVVNATILPLAFVSDVFLPLEDPPRWLDVVGDVFPLKPFVTSFQNAFNPLVDAPGIRWGALAVVAAWGVLGAVVAVGRFRWEAGPGASVSRRRRAQAA
jgi:ABC-2 type transport system permease protein